MKRYILVKNRNQAFNKRWSIVLLKSDYGFTASSYQSKGLFSVSKEYATKSLFFFLIKSKNKMQL